MANAPTGGSTATEERTETPTEEHDETKAKSGVVSLNEVITTDKKDAVRYDKSGALVTKDGQKIALAADATDPDVGWTVQQARAEKDPVAYPGGPATVPDQTVHPDELPDPVAALRAGLLPQNTEVLNIDPKKFRDKHGLGD
jgi:hypothetical protein